MRTALSARKDAGVSRAAEFSMAQRWMIGQEGLC
jgi:hypothetical protein